MQIEESLSKDVAVTENILKPLPVGELIKQKENKPIYHFYIPAYQRGYRWDNDQVHDLLEDLFEFVNQNQSTKYCLQPVVVKMMESGVYEVLDGQQRLTTIYILLKCLKTYLPKITTFLISYQTRPNSALFLEELTSLDYTEDCINDINPDYYFISKAYSTIGKWIDRQNDENPEITSTLYAALVKRIEFIWYEITEKTDAIEVFTRINIGKIPLTNAELVKAVFLSKNNLSAGTDGVESKWLSGLQNKIATEWDLIEAKLQKEKFWGFIFNGTKDYETRIDYILELKYNLKDEKNLYASFRCFYDEIKKLKQDQDYLTALSHRNTTLIEDEWFKVKFIIEILEDWYEDLYYFHHIGFLIIQGISILELIEDYLQLDKDEFNIRIEDRIRSVFDGYSLSGLKYDKEPKMIENVLLLYNILSTYKLNDLNNKFPFELYRNDNWSLEHIYAQNSEKLRIDQYDTWLKENLKSLKNLNDPDLTGLLNGIIDGISKIEDLKKDPAVFTDLFNQVTTFYQEKLEEIDRREGGHDDDGDYQVDLLDDSYLTEVHSIVNLTLLDSKSNSSLSNSLFDVKRMLIIDKDKLGIYLPIETKRIFLKYHTQLPNHLFYWTIEDKKSYFQDLERVLSNKYIIPNNL